MVGRALAQEVKMRHFRGFVDVWVLLFLVVASIPVCLIAPTAWEALLDKCARYLLFKRTQAAK